MTHALRRSLFASLLVAVLALGAAACRPAAPGSGTAPGWAASMLAQVNAQRAAAGAPGLAWCGTLAGAAQRHSNDQAARNTMSHDFGVPLAARVQGAGYNGWNALGENVAAGATTVESVMGLWLNSPGHRGNILNPGFTHFGAGLNNNFWTQDFGRGGTC